MNDPLISLLPFSFIIATFTLVGACIGSFLNVAIYRLPLGLSVNYPRRSFCPCCKTPIKWFHNIPLLSWCLLKGKCASCHAPISVRYVVIEALTALLFGAIAYCYAEQSLLWTALLCLWTAGALVISCIDAEHMLVFPRHTIYFAIIGCLTFTLFPWDPSLEDWPWYELTALSLLGAVVGFVIIRLVIELGKLLFGTITKNYPEAGHWELKEPTTETEDLQLLLPDGALNWGELFSRASDRADFTHATLCIDGQLIEGDHFSISADKIIDASGTAHLISEITSASGTVKNLKANREAMGYGDAWILLMVGATLGWEGSIFCLLLGSLMGILVGIIARIGFSRPLPFGPCLLGAAIIWMLGGYHLWDLYCELLG